MARIISPMSVRNRAEMNFATIIPTRTAAPVHTVWPRHPPKVKLYQDDFYTGPLLSSPTMTPYTLLIPASTMVASWDRSPHSAMKVIVRQLRKS